MYQLFLCSPLSPRPRRQVASVPLLAWICSWRVHVHSSRASWPPRTLHLLPSPQIVTPHNSRSVRYSSTYMIATPHNSRSVRYSSTYMVNNFIVEIIHQNIFANVLSQYHFARFVRTNWSLPKSGYPQAYTYGTRNWVYLYWRWFHGQTCRLSRFQWKFFTWLTKLL